MKRAKQSAQIIADYVKAPIIYDDRLKEVNMGVVEGMHVQDVAKKFPELYKKWQNCCLSDKTTHFENGETKRQVRQRVFSALEQYAQSKYNNIAISGHGITLTETLHALDIDKDEVDNGEIIHLQYDNDNWHYIGCTK